MKHKLAGKMKKKTKFKIIKHKKSEIEKEEFKALQVINKLMKTKANVRSLVNL